VALYLFDHTVRFSQLNAKSATLAANLFQLAKKSGAGQEELSKSLGYLLTVPGKLNIELHKKLSR